MDDNKYFQQFKGAKNLEFHYESDFDQNGVLFYIGTKGLKQPYQNPAQLGLVKVFMSSLRKGKLDFFVGRECRNLSTQNERNSYMGVDLGQERYLLPSCYTLRNRNSAKYAMVNWVFEGSMNGIDWFVLDKRIHYQEGNKQFNLMMENEF